MYAIEFTAKINKGKIDVPLQYQDKFTSDVKVILLHSNFNDTLAEQHKRNQSKGFGALAHRANPTLWEQENNAWEIR